MNYTYRLLEQITGLNLCSYKKNIEKVLKTFNGSKIVVYERGFSFYVPDELTDGEKRSMGRKLASIPGIGEFAITYDYTYEDGRQGISRQLFRIVE